MKSRERIFIVALLCALIFYSANISVRAIEARGITVLPSLIIEEVTEGDNSFFSTIINNTGKDLQVSVSVAGLSMGITGNTIIKESKTELETAKRIFNIYPREFILKTGGIGKVRIEVNIKQVKEVMHSKGAYGVLIFKTQPCEKEEGSVTMVTRMATPAWVSLPGPKDRSGEITEVFAIQDKPKDRIKIAVIFKNKGDIYFTPQSGSIIIRDEDKKEVKRISIEPKLIMPDFKRVMYGYFDSEDLPIDKYSIESIICINSDKNINTNTMFGNFSIISPGILAQPNANISDFPEIKIVKNNPINFSFLFNNTGNVNLNPILNLEIIDLENNIIASVPIENKEVSIGCSEEFKAIYQKGLDEGEYRAIAIAEFGKPEYGILRKAAAIAKVMVIEDKLILEGEISKFNIDSIKSGEAVEPELFFKNTGNTELSVEGLIELKDNTGKTVGQIPINKTEVKEGEEKRLGESWSGILPTGSYKAVVTLIYAEDKIITDETSFLVK